MRECVNALNGVQRAVKQTKQQSHYDDNDAEEDDESIAYSRNDGAGMRL